MNNKLVDKLFLIILSVQTLAMGVAFFVQILRLYYTEGMYNREICATYLKEILVVIILWLVLVLISSIYFFIVKKKEKNTQRLSNLDKLKTILRIAPDFNNEALNSEYERVLKERKKRLIAKSVNLGILVICSIMGILYLCNPKHFDSAHATEGIIKMSYYLLPWVIIALISSIVVAIICELSCKAEAVIIKTIIKTDGRVKPSYNPNRKLELCKTIFTYSLLLTAVVLIIVGAFDGTAEMVLQKAVVICTECIGLG